MPGSRSRTPWPGASAGGAVDRSSARTGRRRARVGSGAKIPIHPERVVTKPKLEVRRQAKLHLDGAVPEGREAPMEALPGIDGSAGCSCRRSVAEVGRRIFFVFCSVCREASRISAG
jgi:hypothetical protein